MEPRRVRDIEASLQRKGFHKMQWDHHYFHLYVNGKKTAIFTKTSHGIKEYGGQLLKSMAWQLRLSTAELYRLVDCPMSEEERIEPRSVKTDVHNFLR